MDVVDPNKCNIGIMANPGIGLYDKASILSFIISNGGIQSVNTPVLLSCIVESLNHQNQVTNCIVFCG